LTGKSYWLLHGFPSENAKNGMTFNLELRWRNNGLMMHFDGLEQGERFWYGKCIDLDGLCDWLCNRPV